MEMYSRYGDFRYLIRDGYAVITGYEEISHERIEIPSEIEGIKVKVIEKEAFYYCSLKQLIISEGVEEICSEAFSECSNLKKVSLPSTIRKIHEHAFYACDSLEILKVPVNCEIAMNAVVSRSFRCYIYTGEGSRHQEIDGVIFDRETDYLVLYPKEKLDSEYAIPDFVKGVAPSAFKGITALKKVIIPESMKNINFDAFKGFKGLEEIVMHDNIEWIESDAFSGCSSLKHIEFPKNLKGFERYAFSASGLEEVTLPDNTFIIPEGAFSYCTELRCVKNTEKLLAVKRYSFKYCSSLEEFTFGSGIVTIDTQSFTYCTSLKKVNMPEFSKKPHFDESDKKSYDVLPESLITIQSECFMNCDLLESISVPRNTKFYSSNIVDRCKNFRKLFLPLSIDSISGDDFGRPTCLTDIFYEGSEEDWKKIKKSQRLEAAAERITIHYNCKGIE